MAHSFQRASQSLRADRGISSTIVLTTALLLLMAWVVWALRATVPRYQASLSACTLTPSSPGRLQIQAEFPPAVLGDIHPGQPALFRPSRDASLPDGALRARVLHVANEIQNAKANVELSLEAPLPSKAAFGGLPGSVDVEVEQVTPAALLMRSAGGLVGGH